MKLSAQNMMLLDRLFEPLRRALEFSFENLGLINQSNSSQIVAIKLMGKGNIVRLASMCRELSVDMSQLTLITFAEHRDVCDLCGIENVCFIRTMNIFQFLKDVFSCLRKIRGIRPSVVVTLERCSQAAGAFGLMLSWRSRCRNISFESNRKKETDKISIFSAEELSFKNLLRTCVILLPPSHHSIKENRKVPVDVNKILININASDLLSARRYSLQNFATAIRELNKRNNSLQFILTGSGSEMKYVQSLADQVDISIRNVAGEWSLAELANELERAAVLITGDSMPIHLARYLEVPVVALWGPTQASQFGYENMSFIKNISNSLSCAPCFLTPKSKTAIPCEGRIDCMVISPERVVNAVLEFIEQGKDERSIPNAHSK